MNCKPGDMAIIVGGSNAVTHHIGKIVTVVKIDFEDAWICDPQLLRSDGKEVAWRDYHLRPIRPSDEQDEMLRIVGLPNKEKEKV